MEIKIEKTWDGNESTREGANGRTYTSRGRWQWLVIVDGAIDSAHELMRHAAARRALLLMPSDECPKCSTVGRGPLCKAHRADDETFGPASYPVDERMIAAPEPAAEARPRSVAARLRKLERQARTLLAAMGDLSGEFDSARLGAAMGHTMRVVEELHEAAAVRAAVEVR